MVFELKRLVLSVSRNAAEWERGGEGQRSYDLCVLAVRIECAQLGRVCAVRNEQGFCFLLMGLVAVFFNMVCRLLSPVDFCELPPVEFWCSEINRSPSWRLEIQQKSKKNLLNLFVRVASG